jgi:hypothetical protein
MNCQAFTNDSLIMMYEGVRGALESDDELVTLGEQPRFRIRDARLEAARCRSRSRNDRARDDIRSVDWG